MKKFIPLLFLLNLFSSLLYPNILTDEETAFLIRSLKIHGISEWELGFEKKWVSDSIFMLSAVKQLMDNPLKTPIYLENTKNKLEMLKEDLPTLLLFLNKNLDINITLHDIEKIEKKINVNISDTSFSTIIRIMKHSFEVGSSYLKQSIKKLSNNELDKLLMALPTLWGDENDTLTKLKGALHRELGLEVDTTAKVDIDTILELITKIDRKSLSLAYLSVIIGTKKIEELLSKLKSENLPVKKPYPYNNLTGNVYYYEETEWGMFIIGSEENNIYTDDCALIIDWGGNDIYCGKIGSGIGVISTPFSVVIDKAGNDIYKAQNKLGTLGAGILGCGIILDEMGDDSYQGNHYSIGAGILGLGAICDCKGDDTYFGGCFSIGAGNWGIGMVIDHQGSDSYRAYEFSQAFSSTWGYGLLADFEGNDLYYAGGKYLHTPLLPNDYRSLSQGFSIGFRPIAAGGISFLYDKSGQDNYNVGAFGQGASYLYSLGMLYDHSGNDFYNATEYAQGAGIHLAVGILIDNEGSDHYFSRLGPAQGEGHDLSVGILIDKKGDDSYLTSGGQGVGLTNSWGFLLDTQGDDFYGSKEKGIRQGSANWARGFSGVGVFLDLGGNDVYPNEEIFGDNQYWTQPVFGSGIDTGLYLPDKEEIIQEEPDTTLNKIEDIFKIAATWDVGNAKKKVRWAKEKLKQSPGEAIAYIFANKISTKDGLELRAIEDLAKTYPDSFKSPLFFTLYHQDRWARANAAYLLGKIKAQDALDSLYRAYKENRIRARTMISALEEIGDSAALRIILPHLKDTDEPTRIAAARALGKLKHPRAVPYLYQALSDKYFTVRIAAESALVAIGDPALKYLLTKKSNPKIIGILGVLGAKLDTLDKEKNRKEVLDIIIPYLKHPLPEIRLKALEALSQFSEVKPLLQEHSSLETDKFVLTKYRQLLK
ncbi:MAG: HEAT repeat domain-containing protein [candidate division WOR-3 bacterium]|nr:HEAT repeat domain-containing protein [candidate division WOR-3 bacterium]